MNVGLSAGLRKIEVEQGLAGQIRWKEIRGIYMVAGRGQEEYFRCRTAKIKGLRQKEQRPWTLASP